MATKKITKPSPGAGRTFKAFRFNQRDGKSPDLVMFHAPVGKIKQFADVAELASSSRGPQREQKEARVQAIAKFLAANDKNTIPTALVLAFADGNASFKDSPSGGAGTLTILADGTDAATIVDGQHRLFGIATYDDSIEVPVIALLKADKVERFFQFLVINNKASKVPATHTKALLANMKATALAERLRGAKMAFDVDGIKDVDLVNSDPDSPFFKTIDWTATPKANRMIQATAIESSLDYLGGLGLAEFDDRDVRRSVFLVIWKTIKAVWKPLWKKDSRLVSKVGIFCLTRLIVDRIANWADSDELDIQITDLEQIEKQTRSIIGYIDSRLWTTPWAEKSAGGFDTAQGRERVLAAITQVYRNGRRDIAWYTDIDIVDKTAASK